MIRNFSLLNPGKWAGKILWPLLKFIPRILMIIFSMLWSYIIVSLTSRKCSSRHCKNRILWSCLKQVRISYIFFSLFTLTMKSLPWNSLKLELFIVFLNYLMSFSKKYLANMINTVPWNYLSNSVLTSFTCWIVKLSQLWMLTLNWPSISFSWCFNWGIISDFCKWTLGILSPIVFFFFAFGLINVVTELGPWTTRLLLPWLSKALLFAGVDISDFYWLNSNLLTFSF